MRSASQTRTRPIGAVDFDAHALGVDFATGGTVKYLLGSSGLGFLYVRAGLLPDLLPSQTGWFADEDIFRMDISDYSPAADARRFDAGTPPVPNIYGGLAGMSLIEEAGTAAIEEHVAGLAEPPDRRPRGARRGRRDAARPRPPRPARLRPLDRRPMRSSQTLAAEKIICSERDANLRVSLHLYNVEDDVDRVLDALRRNRPLLAQ